ncbi:hypothetical protein KKG05_03830, partial [bacterium]|nr:hypothetical protein [bacterium]
MGNLGQVIGLKFEAAKERCHALKAELDKLDPILKLWASPQGCQALHKFLSQANETLLNLFEAESKNSDLSVLSPYEQELRIHRTCSLVPLLFEYLGILSGAEINQTSAEIALPLRRFVKDLLPEAEVLLRANYQLNYSIIEITEDIRKLFSETSFLSATNDLPKLLYIINVPPIKANDALLNSILAHEAAHGIYKQEGLADKILPRVKLQKKMIESWSNKIVSKQRSAKVNKGETIGFPFEEIEVRRMLTVSATGTIENWVAEMCCDALAITILGPAYFFGFVHFFSTVTMLDRLSASHPPPRLRIHLMCRHLQNTNYDFKDHPKLSEFLGSWSAMAKEKPDKSISTNLPLTFAFNAISNNKLIDLISKVAIGSVPKGLQYSQAKFLANIKAMGPLLVENVPAAELRCNPDEGCEIPGIAEILNTGWYIKLTSFDAFQSSLPDNISGDRSKSERCLHGILLKCMELSEIKRRWNEVKA